MVSGDVAIAGLHHNVRALEFDGNPSPTSIRHVIAAVHHVYG